MALRGFARLLHQLAVANNTSPFPPSSATPSATPITGQRPPLPPYPPSPPSTSGIDGFLGAQRVLTDQNLIDAAYIDLALFGFFSLAYCLLQSQSILYRFRQVSPTVSSKPPMLPNGLRASWSWFVATFTVTDEQLLVSAGLDALMMVKMQTLGLQLFLPMAFVGGVVLIPINLYGDQVAESAASNTLNPSNFMKLTMTNVNDGAAVLWVHFFCVLLYTLYAMWLLKWHYHQYIIIRHHYMRQGDSVNVWRHLQDARAGEAEGALRQRNPFLVLADAVVNTERQLRRTVLKPGMQQMQNAARAVGSAIGAGAVGAHLGLGRGGVGGEGGVQLAGGAVGQGDGEGSRGRRSKERISRGKTAKKSPRPRQRGRKEQGDVEAPDGFGSPGLHTGTTSPGAVHPTDHPSPPSRWGTGPLSPGPAARGPSAAATSYASSAGEEGGLDGLPGDSGIGGGLAASVSGPSGGPMGGLRHRSVVIRVPGAGLPTLPEQEGQAPTAASTPGRAAPSAGRASPLESPAGGGVHAAGTHARPRALRASQSMRNSFLARPSLTGGHHHSAAGNSLSGGWAVPTAGPAAVSGSAGLEGGVVGDDKATRLHEMQEMTRMLDAEFDGASEGLFSRVGKPLALAALLGRISKQRTGPLSQLSMQGRAPTLQRHSEQQPPQQPLQQPLQHQPSQSQQQQQQPAQHAYASPLHLAATAQGSGQAATDGFGAGVGSFDDLEHGHVSPGEVRLVVQPGGGPLGAHAPQADLQRAEEGRGAGRLALGPLASGALVQEEAGPAGGAGMGAAASGELAAGAQEDGRAPQPSPSVKRAKSAALTSAPTDRSMVGSDASDSDGWDVETKVSELPRWWGNVRYKYYKKNATMPTLHALAGAITMPRAGSNGIRAALSTSASMQAPDPQLMTMQVDTGTTLLSQPSVRFRKTINTADPLQGGQLVAVNAQQYAVLVTDVNQDSMHANRRLWRDKPRNEGGGFLSTLLPWKLRMWMFHNYAASTTWLQKQAREEKQASAPLADSGRGTRMFSVGSESEDEWSDGETGSASEGSGSRTPEAGSHGGASQHTRAEGPGGVDPADSPAHSAVLGGAVAVAVPAAVGGGSGFGSEAAVTHDEAGPPASVTSVSPPASPFEAIGVAPAVTGPVGAGMGAGATGVRAGAGAGPREVTELPLPPLASLPSVSSWGKGGDAGSGGGEGKSGRGRERSQGSGRERSRGDEIESEGHPAKADAPANAANGGTQGLPEEAAGQGAALERAGFSPKVDFAQKAGSAPIAGGPAESSGPGPVAEGTEAPLTLHGEGGEQAGDSAGERAAQRERGEERRDDRQGQERRDVRQGQEVAADADERGPSVRGGAIGLAPPPSLKVFPEEQAGGSQRGASGNIGGVGQEGGMSAVREVSGAGDGPLEGSNGAPTPRGGGAKGALRGGVSHGEGRECEEVRERSSHDGASSLHGTGNDGGGNEAKDSGGYGLGMTRAASAMTGDVSMMSASPKPRRRVLKPGSKWAVVQDLVSSGALQDLPFHKRYSLVSAKFQTLFPDTFDRAIPVIKHRKVDVLLQQLDLVMWQYQRAEVQYKYSGKRPVTKAGFCGLWGEQVDVLRQYRRQMLDLQDEIRKERKRLLREGSTPSWFVFFKTQYAAAVAAQALLHGEDHRQFSVHPAPGPEEVNWSALWLNYKSRDLRGWIFKPLLCLLILIPIGIFTGMLMQLQFFLCPNRTCQSPTTGEVTTTNGACPDGFVDVGNKFYWEWYCTQDDGTPARLLGRLAVSWVPSLLVTLWQGMVLPLVSYILVQACGQCLSLSEVDRTIARWIWWFSAFNVFLGGIIGSTLASQIQSILEQGPWQVIVIIGSYLPSSSTYFLNYIMIRTLVSLPLRFVQPSPVIRFYIFRRWLRCTRAPLADRDKAFLYTPCSPRYGYDVGVVCGIFLIAFAYAVISPIIVIACLAFFGMSWLFWRYNLMYVYIRKYEAGGVFWPFVFNRICNMLIVMSLITACVFIVKRAYVPACILIVLTPLWVLRFNNFAQLRFAKGIQGIPLELAIAAPPAQVDPRVYIPPPLNRQAMGWHPEWIKPWSGWGLVG